MSGDLLHTGKFKHLTDEQLNVVKNAYKRRARQWAREMVYLEGTVVEHKGVKWERTIEGIGFTPPPECTSCWRRVDG